MTKSTMKVYAIHEEGGCGGCGDGWVIKIFDSKEKAINHLKSLDYEIKEYKLDNTIAFGSKQFDPDLNIQEFELE